MKINLIRIRYIFKRLESLKRKEKSLVTLLHFAKYTLKYFCVKLSYWYTDINVMNICNTIQISIRSFRIKNCLLKRLYNIFTYKTVGFILSFQDKPG